MVPQAVNIQVLMLNGTMDGVARIEHSSWPAGELYTAPRNCLADLMQSTGLSRPGVIFLLSDLMICICPSSMFHLEEAMEEGWWESCTVLTSKYDSLTQEDSLWLTAVLTEKAREAGHLQVLTDTAGTIPDMDLHRRAFLEQYLDGALFLLQFRGIKAFCTLSENHAASDSDTETDTTPSDEGSSDEPASEPPPVIPDLPSGDLKIGAFVYQSMQNLSASGYVFPDEEIEEMCTPEWSLRFFHTKHPFFKRYVAGQTDTKGPGGWCRFRATPFTFGSHTVLISKEWYERQRPLFIAWYCSLQSRQAAVSP